MECCDTEGWNYAAQYANALEADPTASSYVKLFTSHGYTAPPKSPLAGWTNPVWETEWSTFETWDPSWDDGTDASGFSWAQRIYQGLTSADLSAFFYWWGTSTPTYNGDNESLVQINGSTVVPSGRLWAFANFSRFVRPGAVRIAASTDKSSLEITDLLTPRLREVKWSSVVKCGHPRSGHDSHSPICGSLWPCWVACCGVPLTNPLTRACRRGTFSVSVGAPSFGAAPLCGVQ